MSSFRFQARYGLFTYSQCARLRPDAVSQHYEALGANYIIGREAHGDGGSHLHVFADFRRKFRTRDNRKFDVEVSIQISFLHSEILLAVGTMQRRMATYVAGDCQDQNLMRVLRVGDRTLAGTDSDLQRLEMTFSELQASISLVILSSPSILSVHTQTGSLEWIERLMLTIQNSRLILHNWLEFGNGLGDFLPNTDQVCTPLTLRVTLTLTLT